MLIDADTHICEAEKGKSAGPTASEFPWGISAGKLVEKMKQNNIDKAITWLNPHYYGKNIHKGNEYVHKATKEHPNKLFGFGWVNPNQGASKSKEEIEKCINEYDFHGVKLNGAANNFYIDSEKKSLPLIEKIHELDGILALHIGANAPDRTHPLRAEKIAEKYPDLKILIVHMGGAGTPHLSKAAIQLAQNHTNTILIGSEIEPDPILEAAKKVPKKTCFGSDTPFATMKVELAKYKALLDKKIPKETQKRIMGENIQKILQK